MKDNPSINEIRNEFLSQGHKMMHELRNQSGSFEEFKNNVNEFLEDSLNFATSECRADSVYYDGRWRILDFLYQLGKLNEIYEEFEKYCSGGKFSDQEKRKILTGSD